STSASGNVAVNAARALVRTRPFGAAVLRQCHMDISGDLLRQHGDTPIGDRNPGPFLRWRGRQAFAVQAALC
ncbi:MAG: hypothetical protein ABW220_13465, partial [Burkholderiaceae bacterium]